MPKLHEGLAIHKDRMAVTRKLFEEAQHVFKNAVHFQGFVKRTQYLDAANERFNKTEEKKVDETVPSKLTYISEPFAKLLDLDYQMEMANRTAVADFVIDGHVLAREVPVNFLLTVENKFKELREVLNMIPTHAPGVQWNVNTDISSNRDVYTSQLHQIDYLTKKIAVHKVVVNATEHHPAQVAETHDDVRVAEVTTTRHTGTISPAEKSDMLGRCDKIIIAAKRARQRANNVNLPSGRIARPMLDYVLSDVDIDGWTPAEDQADI